MKNLLLDLDRRLIRSSERHRSPVRDELFTGASRLADHSLLWLVTGVCRLRRAGAGLRADGLLRGVAGDRKPATAAAPSPSLPKELVLLVSPHAGRSSGLETARQPSTGLSVVAELEIEAVERLPGLAHRPEGHCTLSRDPAAR